MGRAQRGFGLVEIMVSLVIGAILVGGIIQVFLANKQNYRVQESLARLQESGRFAVNFLADDIRMAGYMGGARLGKSEVNVIVDPPNDIDFSLDTVVRGYVNDGGLLSPAYEGFIPGYGVPTNIRADTDMLSIQYADSCGAYVNDHDNNNANVQVAGTNTCGFQQNEHLLISDGSTADIFCNTNNPVGQGVNDTAAHSNGCNIDNRLSKIYGPSSQVYRLLVREYYIGTNADGRSALYRRDRNGAQELVEDVVDMQLLYGINNPISTRPNVDRYVDAANVNVSDWANITSIRINLLVESSDDFLTTAPQSYVFNGATVTPADQRLRRVFTATVNVRNRTLGY